MSAGNIPEERMAEVEEYSPCSQGVDAMRVDSGNSLPGTPPEDAASSYEVLPLPTGLSACEVKAPSGPKPKRYLRPSLAAHASAESMSSLPGKVATAPEAGSESMARRARSAGGTMSTELPTLASSMGRTCSARAASSSMIRLDSSPVSADIAEVESAASSFHWHLVSAFDGECELIGRRRTDRISDPFNVLEESEAIVIVGDLRSVSTIKEFVSKLGGQGRRQCSEKVPIIALLVGDSLIQTRLADIAKAQILLCDIGIDDMVMKVGGPAEVSLAVSMSLTRTSLRRKQEAQLRAIVERNAEERLRERLAQHQHEAASGSQMFWRCVDRVLPGFPEMEEGLTEEVDVGGQLGPCKIDFDLGKGRFGKVFAATNVENGQEEAVKVLSKANLNTLPRVKAVWKETRFLSKLQHENITAMYGAFHTTNYIIIRMEVAGQNNMFRALKMLGGRFSVSGCQRMFAQLASAIAHCHSRGVAHRDIKAENIGISDDGQQAKLLDFGLAVEGDKLCSTCVGTMPFTAPEVIAASPKRMYDPMPADIWAMGTTLFEMICGCGVIHHMLGWTASASDQARRRDLTQFFQERPQAFLEEFERSFGEERDEDLLALFRGMFEVNPRRRWTARKAGRSSWLPSKHTRKCPVEAEDEEAVSARLDGDAAAEVPAPE